MNNFSVTILIGATNESEALKKTVECIVDTCEMSDVEKITIVKSKTASAQCNASIAQLEKRYPQLVECLEQTRPFVGGGIQDGADNVRSSHLLVVPGDLAFDPHTYARMIATEKESPEGIVRDSRWLVRDSFVNYSKIRKFFNVCAQAFLRLLYQTDLTDLTHPVQIMPTALYQKLRWKELNFPFLIEFALVPLRLGASITEIPTSCYGRMEGESNNSVWQTALYLKTALRVRFTKKENLLKSTERSAS